MNQFNGFNSTPGCGCSVDLMGGMDPASQMKGTWISKKTGEEIIVRDCIMSGEGGMLVMLADGRMLDMSEFSSEYYQMSDEVYDTNGNVVGKGSNSAPVNIPDYNPNCNCKNDMGFLNKPLPPCDNHHGHHHKPCHPTPPTPPTCGCDESNKALVEKAHIRMVTDVFSKVKPEPVVECGTSLVMTNAPVDQLQMLIDIFGVHIEDIAIYLYKNYYTPEKVISYLKKVLAETYKLKEPDPTVADKDEENPVDPDFNSNTDETV